MEPWDAVSSTDGVRGACFSHESQAAWAEALSPWERQSESFRPCLMGGTAAGICHSRSYS